MSEERKLAHAERIAIRWADMDAMGHVNNTVYFRYMEQTRIGWFEAMVPPAQAWSALGIVIVSTSCAFKRPLRYPGTVEVKLYTGRPGGSSVRTFYDIAMDGTLYAEGEAMVVFIDMQKHKPVRIPDKLRSLMQ